MHSYVDHLLTSGWICQACVAHVVLLKCIMMRLVFHDQQCVTSRTHLTATGREDFDVRMLGSGRPFVLEIINARAEVPCPAIFNSMQLKLEQVISGKHYAPSLFCYLTLYVATDYMELSIIFPSTMQCGTIFELDVQHCLHLQSSCCKSHHMCCR